MAAATEGDAKLGPNSSSDDDAFVDFDGKQDDRRRRRNRRYHTESKRQYESGLRRQRAFTQRIYFLGHQIMSSDIRFSIQGTSGVWEVKFAPGAARGRRCFSGWSCSCPDNRGIPCKHIYFMWARVLGIELPAGSLTSQHPWFDSVAAVEEMMRENHAARALGPPPPSTGDDDAATGSGSNNSTKPRVAQRAYLGEACPVCYETFTTDCLVCFCETNCGNSIHHQCYQNAVNFSGKTSCPYCRADMRPAGIIIRKRRRTV
jgi:hypothetical protein